MAQPKRQHGVPRGRGRVSAFGGEAARKVLAERQKQARKLKRMTPEERTLWRV